MTLHPSACAAMLLAVAAASGPARCGTLAPSVSIVVMQDLGALHARSLLDQLERQFSEFPTAVDQDAAEQAVRKTMAALESKDAFTDWAAYQGLRSHHDRNQSGPLAMLAQWQIFRNRLKTMDDSLLRVEEFSFGKKRGMVAADAPPEFHELEYVIYERNALIARELEVYAYVSGLDHALVMYTLIEEPFFDIDDPIVDRMFEPEFVIMVRRTLDLHRERMYPQIVESNE